MATPTMDRQRTAEYRSVASSRTQNRYGNAAMAGTAVRVPDYARPFPKVTPTPAAPPKVDEKTRAKAKRKRLIRTFSQIVVVAVMCFLMIYRYAMILETNALISTMNQQIAEMEYDNQYLEAKLDSALELDTLETYATEELGMIRPDSSQKFYVNITMEDGMATQEGTEENRMLQGTPGALVHAIRVLK